MTDDMRIMTKEQMRRKLDAEVKALGTLQRAMKQLDKDDERGWEILTTAWGKLYRSVRVGQENQKLGVF